MIDILKSLAEKAGVSNTPAFIGLLASPEIQAIKDFKFDSEIESAFNSKLISIESAKTHKDVINHVKGLELGKVDLATKKTLTDLGLSEVEVNEIMSVGTTDTKVTEAIKRIDKLREKQGKSGNSDKEKVLSDQIAALTAKLQSDVAEKDSTINSLKNDFESYKRKSALSKALNGHELRDDLSRDDLEMLVEADLNKYLSTKGAKLHLNGNGLELRDAENIEVPYLDRDLGRNINFSDAFGKILAENKRLKVSNVDNKQGSVVAPAGVTPMHMPQDAQLAALIQAQLKG